MLTLETPREVGVAPPSLPVPPSRMTKWRVPARVKLSFDWCLFPVLTTTNKCGIMPKCETRLPQDRGSKQFRELPPLAGMESATFHFEFRRAIQHTTGASAPHDIYRRDQITQRWQWQYDKRLCVPFFPIGLLPIGTIWTPPHHGWRIAAICLCPSTLVPPLP